MRHCFANLRPFTGPNTVSLKNVSTNLMEQIQQSSFVIQAPEGCLIVTHLLTCCQPPMLHSIKTEELSVPQLHSLMTCSACCEELQEWRHRSSEDPGLCEDPHICGHRSSDHKGAARCVLAKLAGAHEAQKTLTRAGAGGAEESNE